MRILAIDPGNNESGIAVIDVATRRPLHIGKIPNDAVLKAIVAQDVRRVGIEMIASYGMPVGQEVFDTCVWVGRFQEVATRRMPTELVYRRDVKLHHCHSSKATDATVTQALVDRFARGQKNRGKGTKADPGWFHGFRADIWQSYALAVYIADQHDGFQP